MKVPDRPPFYEIRREFKAAGFRPSKRLGQNFMLDPQANLALVRACGVGEGDLVLEVGAGAGHLTRAIIEAGARVLAVEIDPRLAGLLTRRLLPGVSSSTARLLVCDVMDGPDRLRSKVVRALEEEMRRELGHDSASCPHPTFKLVSNLPFNIGCIFLLALVGSGLPWERGAVTLQREVAERFTASVGTKRYGASSVHFQLFARGKIERIMTREVFWPRPEVEAAFLVMEPRREQDVLETREGPFRVPDPAEKKKFGAFVKRLFSARRKTLRAALGPLAGGKARAGELLRSLDINPRSRPERLAPESFADLFRAVTDSRRTGDA